MKIGVISDIHSNIHAFRACLDYLEGRQCQEYLFLGDYVSDTPYTRETLDTLYAFMEGHTCRLLRGNREEYMLAQRKIRQEGPKEQQWIYNSASGNLLYAYRQLTDRDFAFFEELPISFRYEKEGYPAITCCHGSPVNARELVQLYGDHAKSWLERIDTDYMICAHTHFPGELSWEGKYYFNAGCVGIAIGDYGYAQCMLLESVGEEGRTRWQPTFLRIPYDNGQVVRDIHEKGLLDAAPWFVSANIQILLTGVDHSAELVQLAAELAQKAGESAVWPLLGEQYFEEAAGQLGIPDYRRK